MIYHTYKIRFSMFKKAIEVPGRQIKSLGNISLTVMVKRIHEENS